MQAEPGGWAAGDRGTVAVLVLAAVRGAAAGWGGVWPEQRWTTAGIRERVGIAVAAGLLLLPVDRDVLRSSCYGATGSAAPCDCHSRAAGAVPAAVSNALSACCSAPGPCLTAHQLLHAGMPTAHAAGTCLLQHSNAHGRTSAAHLHALLQPQQMTPLARPGAPAGVLLQPQQLHAVHHDELRRWGQGRGAVP